jgi:hypothetical protein
MVLPPADSLAYISDWLLTAARATGYGRQGSAREIFRAFCG